MRFLRRTVVIFAFVMMERWYDVLPAVFLCPESWPFVGAVLAVVFVLGCLTGAALSAVWHRKTDGQRS